MYPSPRLSAGRRVTLVVLDPKVEGASKEQMPNYGVRRVHAALLGDPRLGDAELRYVEAPSVGGDIEAVTEEVLSGEPDVVGFSVYVWSFPHLVEVARRVKRRRPEVAIVFGGPSARRAMFDLAPYMDAPGFVDAICEGEGEYVFADLVALPNRGRDAIATVPGLVVPGGERWVETPRRPQIMDLDALPSPFQTGIMWHHTTAYLETYRGCPFSCSFCEWGPSAAPKTSFSKEYIARELRAFREHEAEQVFLLDAGLNLFPKGFRALKAAEEEVGLLRDVLFICELYPSHIAEEHIEFLANIRKAHVVVGLQTLDTEVLGNLRRPMRYSRFESVVTELSKLHDLEIELIIGLPGDSPEAFRRTFEYSRTLGCDVRIHRCLVLPGGLITRAPAGAAVEFDPYTCFLTACDGWSAERLRAEADFYTKLALQEGGQIGAYWWGFPKSPGQSLTPSGSRKPFAR